MGFSIEPCGDSAQHAWVVCNGGDGGRINAAGLGVRYEVLQRVDCGLRQPRLHPAATRSLGERVEQALCAQRRVAGGARPARREAAQERQGAPRGCL
jgi:hypothetical protein